MYAVACGENAQRNGDGHTRSEGRIDTKRKNKVEVEADLHLSAVDRGSGSVRTPPAIGNKAYCVP